MVSATHPPLQFHAAEIPVGTANIRRKTIIPIFSSFPFYFAPPGNSPSRLCPHFFIPSLHPFNRFWLKTTSAQFATLDLTVGGISSSRLPPFPLPAPLPTPGPAFSHPPGRSSKPISPWDDLQAATTVITVQCPAQSASHCTDTCPQTAWDGDCGELGFEEQAYGSSSGTTSALSVPVSRFLAHSGMTFSFFIPVSRFFHP